MMSNRLHAFAEQNELIEALSRRIAGQLQEAIAKKGKASLIVSGGSTPKPLFEKLRKREIAWEKVRIGLCDERWVDPSHEASNERFVKTHLLQERASAATFVGMYNDRMAAEEAEHACSEKIRTALYPFDVLILGMGNDAHTASLFPENAKLPKAFDPENGELCIAIEPATAPHMRMSLTLAAILSAKHLYLHFEGGEKQAVYQEALAGEDIYKMPIRAILHQNITDVEVYFR
ncbi:6-phosphogluconolactonase [bacterium]|jgi:6-phosphogluconolactonase|nr:6-phosphogluconolactonase [bacterium]